MFKAINKMKGREDRGFTLVELLIVVAIIGILAAIAIPQFGAYRRRGYNASAVSDLRNIRTSEEAMMADFTEYGVSRTTTTDVGQFAGQAIVGGGTITLVAARTQSQPNVSVALSPGVIGMATGSSTATGVAAASYVLATGHGSGDQYYGANSVDTRIYRKGMPLSSITQADISSRIIATATGATTASSGDLITGNWVSVQ